MAKIPSKGTALKVDIATVYTTVAQVISLNGPDAEVQTFNGTSLDGGVGMPKIPTGYVDGGTVSGELFFDPVAATHQQLTDDITNPIRSSGAELDRGYKLVWPDSAATEWAFDGVVKRFGPSATLQDGLKASFAVEVNGIVTYPT